MNDEDIIEQLYTEMPKELKKFLDSLNKDQLKRIDALGQDLFASIYQAGSVFALGFYMDLIKKRKL